MIDKIIKVTHQTVNLTALQKHSRQFSAETRMFGATGISFVQCIDLCTLNPVFRVISKIVWMKASVYRH